MPPDPTVPRRRPGLLGGPRLADGAVVLALAGLVAILAAAGRVPTGDGPHLAALTMAVADQARGGDPWGAIGTFVTRVAPQPPVGYLPGVLATLLVGNRWLAMLLPGAVALGVCWDALRRLGNGGTPWGPALVLAASPMVWLYTEQYGWDLLTAAAMLQALSWLHLSDGLRDRSAAIRFGLWMGAGFLTKYTFGMYLWLPCLWEAIRIARGPDRARRLRVLGVAILAFGFVFVPWIVVNGSELSWYLQRSVGAGALAAVDTTRVGAARFSLGSLALYPLALKDALGWPGLAALLAVGIAGSVPALARPAADAGGRTGAGLALLAALGGVGVLSCLEQSQDRYALPALAALAALALPIGRLRWGQEVFGGVFVIQLIATLATFWPGAPAGAEPRFDHGLATAAAMSWPRTRSYLPTHLDLDAWHVDAVLEGPASATLPGSDARVALVLPNDPRLPEPGIYLMRARQRGLLLDLRIFRPGDTTPPPEGWPSVDVRWVYATVRPGRDPSTEAWLAAQPRPRSEVFTLPGGATGGVYGP
ncbi:MAG: hypothetical protein Q8P18_03725 [Pseudomonadota bacterium]|nr:hypothetical protein [Pseudomonadota bacterium]